MKITSLEIKNYKQFTDLTLDLTYPKGHPKEGQPLDKICIIGQSGTGKTNLLNMIRDKVYCTDAKTVFIEDENSNSEKIYFSEVEKSINQKINNIKISEEDKKIIDDLERTSHKLLIKDNGDYSTSDWQHASIHDAIKSIEEKYTPIIQLNDEIESQVININNSSSWKLLKEKIDNYEKEKTIYTKKLFNKMMHSPNYSKENSISDMQKWENENENILEKIADDINSIIRKFNLELKIDENTNSYEELIIKDLSNGYIIEYEHLSTGTKNLLSTFIPLKSYNPKDSMILIDEPENSFYPDIQIKLTDLYMNVGENNQLIMATHSPLIISSFEPWEVVELKFDKNNQIYRELYYEGENHVDNYTLDPRMLTWTSILVDIFDLKEDSFSLREKNLVVYGMLKSEIKAMEKGEARDEKIKKFKKLSALLGLQN